MLTGNFTVYEELETELAHLFGTEAALVFNSGYHANTGILPAVSDAQTLILADKLVHASLIDGIRLSAAKCIRYRHNDLAQLERLLKEHHSAFRQIIIVTESIFSMDGDQADLPRPGRTETPVRQCAALRRRGPRFRRARQAGTRLRRGVRLHRRHRLPCRHVRQGGSTAGAYIVCRKVIREYLVNRMRTLIFTTGLPPVNIAWTLFVVRRLADMRERREHLAHISRTLREALQAQGYTCPGASHIVPMIIGQSADTVLKAEALQRHGFYACRAPAYSAGRNVAHPFFADSGYQARGNRRTEEKNGELEITRKYFKQCP